MEDDEEKQTMFAEESEQTPIRSTKQPLQQNTKQQQKTATRKAREDKYKCLSPNFSQRLQNNIKK